MSLPETARGPRGVIGFFHHPEDLLHAMREVRQARYEAYDAFTPFPVHGLEEAQGLSRSPLPFVTFAAGMTGGTLGFYLQYWTSAVDWPINIGGRPFNSWPAFVPITFELTVLFAALCTVLAMFLLNGLPNLSRKALDPGLTQDRFALTIEAPQARFPFLKNIWAQVMGRTSQPATKPFAEPEVREFLSSLGAHDVRSFKDEGWFA